MSDLRLVLLQTRYQLTSMAHNRRAVVFSLLFPPILLVMFNSVFVRGNETVELSGVTVSAHAYFTGGMLAYAIMLAGFNQLAISLVSQRETGQLKRLRGTPVPTWTYIVATVLRSVVIGLAMAVVLLAIGHFAYGVAMPVRALAELLLYVALGTVTACSLGIAATALIPDVDSASAALPLVTVVLALVSGIFVAVDQLPNWIEHVARVFPVYHLAWGVQSALGAGGNNFDAGNAGALAVWSLAGIVYAARHFRWEPQAAPA